MKHVRQKRAEQLQSLNEWADEVNRLDCSSAGDNQNAKIEIINDVDLDGPPRYMTYINSYKVTNLSKMKHLASKKPLIKLLLIYVFFKIYSPRKVS